MWKDDLRLGPRRKEISELGGLGHNMGIREILDMGYSRMCWRSYLLLGPLARVQQVEYEYGTEPVEAEFTCAVKYFQRSCVTAGNMAVRRDTRIRIFYMRHRDQFWARK